MATHEITSKLTIVCGGHKIGPEKRPTWYRDGNGDYHAEWFKATVGRQAEDGKYHSYTWNLSSDEAEALGNQPIGTTFRVLVRDKVTEKQVTDDAGNTTTVTAPKVTPSADGSVLYHDVILEQIEVAKQGTIARPRMTKYFADVEAPSDKTTGGSEG